MSIKSIYFVNLVQIYRIDLAQALHTVIRKLINMRDTNLAILQIMLRSERLRVATNHF